MFAHTQLRAFRRGRAAPQKSWADSERTGPLCLTLEAALREKTLRWWGRLVVQQTPEDRNAGLARWAEDAIKAEDWETELLLGWLLFTSAESRRNS